jgi:hypothetical protein
VRKVRIATEAKAGLDVGTTMAKKVRQGPAPSGRAASSMLGGIFRKKVWNW